MNAVQFIDSEQEFDFNKNLDDIVKITQKEAIHVQHTCQRVAEFFLRRLSAETSAWGEKAFQSPSAFLKSNQSAWMLLHSFSLQSYTFSGGALTHDDLFTPLWLTLALKGQGLRRMSSDTPKYANKVLQYFLDTSGQEIATIFVKDPWVAYRLGLFQYSINLSELPANLAQASDLKMRNALALDEVNYESALNRRESFSSTERITFLSALLAYANKRKKEAPQNILLELIEFVEIEAREEISSEMAITLAQVINAINLHYLNHGMFSEIDSNFGVLTQKVIPNIENIERKAHILGNAFYQKSILDRRNKYEASEIGHLLQALRLDRHFLTLYYRLAQCLHNKGDARAKIFYEMALVLSPIDFGAANDYGVFLADSGLDSELQGWSEICQTLFPEAFVNETGQGHKSRYE